MRSRPGAQHQSAECSIASCVVRGKTAVSVKDVLAELLDLHAKLMADFPPTADDMRFVVKKNTRPSSAHKGAICSVQSRQCDQNPRRPVSSEHPAPASRQRRCWKMAFLTTKPSAQRAATCPALCAIDKTHLVLRASPASTAGPADGTHELIKIPLEHLAVGPVAGEPGFTVRVERGLECGDTASVFVCLESKAERDTWLSAISSFDLIRRR